MSGVEEKLVRYLRDAKYEDLPSKVIDTAKNMILTIIGTTIAGANSEGCKALVDQIREWGGTEEAPGRCAGFPAHLPGVF
ncbi:MAG: MmgE/PrpD family protein [Deltaproteobacteria bacterium]|nr:MmgE/PrpD family protein [Deltaproteobacteria bacterium]MBW2301982.1 MmgE/PrpD family protein [Deltaproteobacteria bacterium]